MVDAALFIGWGEVVRGREKRAIEVFNEAMQYYAGLVSKREIDSFEPAILEPHGGELAGFVLLRGDAARLERLRRDPEFLHMTARAQLIVDKVGVVGATVGAGIQELMTIYAEESERVKGAITV